MSFKIRQGSTARIALLVTDNEGTPIDITAALVDFALWKRGDSVAAYQIDQTSLSITRNADGTLEIYIAEVTTDDFTLGEYVAETRVTTTVGVPPVLYRESSWQEVEVIDSVFISGLGK